MVASCSLMWQSCFETLKVIRHSPLWMSFSLYVIFFFPLKNFLISECICFSSEIIFVFFQWTPCCLALWNIGCSPVMFTQWLIYSSQRKLYHWYMWLLLWMWTEQRKCGKKPWILSWEEFLIRWSHRLPSQLLLKMIDNFQVPDSKRGWAEDRLTLLASSYNIHLCILYFKNIHYNLLSPFKQHHHQLWAQRISVWKAKVKTTEGRCPSQYLDILVSAGVNRPLTSTTGPLKTSLASKSASGLNPCLLNGIWNPTDLALALVLEEPTLKYSGMETG